MPPMDGNQDSGTRTRAERKLKLDKETVVVLLSMLVAIAAVLYGLSGLFTSF